MRRRLLEGKKSNYKNYIECVYKGSGSNQVVILGGDYFYTNPKVQKMYVDDVETALTDMYYTFNDTKEHTVVFEMSDNSSAAITYMFGGATTLVEVDMSNYNVNDVDARALFNGCSSLESFKLPKTLTKIDTTCYSMFRDCSKLTSINLNGISFNNCPDYKFMFYNCTSLKNVSMDGPLYYNIDNADFSNMFYGVKTSGTFYYNSYYSTFYQKIINQIPSTWTAVAI